MPHKTSKLTCFSHNNHILMTHHHLCHIIMIEFNHYDFHVGPPCSTCCFSCQVQTMQLTQKKPTLCPHN